MSPVTRLSPQHWYRHPWPWALMLVPFSAVIVGIVMISTALYFPDDVVVDTYYKDGKAINQILALDEAARARSLQAQLSRQPAGGFAIELNTRKETVLHLYAYHVTDSKADRAYVFMPAADDDSSGRQQSAGYTINSNDLNEILGTPGIWYLELRGDNNDWRLRRRVTTPLERLEF